MFPRDSVIRRVSAEPAILLGAGRALLLQLAHPAVAAGVDEHSDFQGNPFKRLQGTLEAVYAMVYGSRDLAERVGERVRRVHDFVAGPTYRANDPGNLLWVHATLLDTAVGCYRQLVEPLLPTEVDAYYEEMATVAELFGLARSDQPKTYQDFTEYWDKQVATIEVTDRGRRLARDILRPRLALNLHGPLAPALALNRLVTVGTLPSPLRDQFGLAWDNGRQRRLDRVLAVVRQTNRAVPRAVRTAPVRAQIRLHLRRAARR